MMIFNAQFMSVELVTKLLSGCLVIVFFWVLAWVGKFSLLRVTKKQSPSRRIVWKLLAKTIYLGVNTIGLISALGTLGVNVSAIVASLGLTGFALGFAMKDMLSNLLAGMMILIYQPYKIGQTVKIDSFEGTVEDIDIRVTTLKTDEDQIIIPNSLVLSKVIRVN